MRARLLAMGLAVLAGLTFFGSTGASAQGSPLFAVLLGGNECDAEGVCRKGDLNAYGGATIILVPGGTPMVCFGIVVDNLPAVNAAHIHHAAAGLNAGIFIALNPPNSASGDPRAWSGCVTAGVTTAKLNQIKANPSNFYVNVHATTGPLAAGAVRGQLF